MGAVDVVPFIPIKGCTMEDAIAVSKKWDNGWPLNIISLYSYMKNQLKTHIVKILLCHP